jgi:hypothetical protein
MRCRGKKIKGSGYTKPAATNNSLSPDMQALLAAREAQDARYFPTSAYATHVLPVDPNPPAPRAVSGLGNASTTTTSSQGLKSPAASCTSRS